ncbi:MAG: DUF5677 domain-containing protein [Pyrinomonadaceae bacterium]
MKFEGLWKATDLVLRNYVRMAKDEVSARWKNWHEDLSCREMYEVVGGLLARQTTLATRMALGMNMWNEHIGPLVLRSMADAYITLAWIVDDPVDRSRKFVLYGLGQEKLQVEHLKARLKAENQNPDDSSEVKNRERWIDAQQFGFLTEVNIGSWSGIDTRSMAEQANCLDFYNYSFQPFSSGTHNTWNHIGKYNLIVCPNPLHRYHAMPIVRRLPPSLYFPLEAASYADRAFKLFDRKFPNAAAPPSAYDQLVDRISNLGESVMCELDASET